MTDVNQFVSTCHERNLTASETSFKPDWTSHTHVRARARAQCWEDRVSGTGLPAQGPAGGRDMLRAGSASGFPQNKQCPSLCVEVCQGDEALLWNEAPLLGLPHPWHLAEARPYLGTSFWWHPWSSRRSFYSSEELVLVPWRGEGPKKKKTSLKKAQLTSCYTSASNEGGPSTFWENFSNCTAL